MRRILPVFALPALLAAGPLIAQEPAAAPTPAPAASPQPKAKRVCRQDVALGTIIPKYICHTKEEWAAIAAAEAKNADIAEAGRQRAPTFRPNE